MRAYHQDDVRGARYACGNGIDWAGKHQLRPVPGENIAQHPTADCVDCSDQNRSQRTEPGMDAFGCAQNRKEPNGKRIEDDQQRMNPSDGCRDENPVVAQI